MQNETVFAMLICVCMVLGMVPGKISVAASAETEETVVVDDQNQMKPDIVITSKLQNSIYIMDTKWKVLSEEKANYGISQADMYQM